MKLTIGLNIVGESAASWAKELSEVSEYIYDIHIPHFDGSLPTGRRTIESSKEASEQLIRAMGNVGIQTSLILNKATKKDFNHIINLLDTHYIPSGLKSVIVSDLELAQLLHSNTDIEIHGSCLSYSTSIDHFEKERLAGITLHNPAVNIIREPEKLKILHTLGYRLKVIVTEGCIRNCSHEISHRKTISSGVQDPYCTIMIAQDCRYFFLANWITLKRLKELSPYIDVIKMPRGSFRADNPSLLVADIKTFIDRYENNIEYNIFDYLAVPYSQILTHKYLSSKEVDNDFFAFSDNCNMECEKLNCHRCFDIWKKVRSKTS